MTEPLTILLTAEDVDKAPKGTILCDLNEPYSLWMAAGIDSREAIVEVLPLRVLRWGKDHYPTGEHRGSDVYRVRRAQLEMIE